MERGLAKLLTEEEIRVKNLNRVKMRSINSDMTHKEIEEAVHVLWEAHRLSLVAKWNSGTARRH